MGNHPSGKTVIGVLYSNSDSGSAADSQVAAIMLPAATPTAPIIAYGTATYGNSVDPCCSEIAAEPTASPGLLCIYIDYSFGFKNINAGMLSYGNYLRFGYIRLGEACANLDTYYGGSWAYTTP